MFYYIRNKEHGTFILPSLCSNERGTEEIKHGGYEDVKTAVRNFTKPEYMPLFVGWNTVIERGDWDAGMWTREV